MSLLDISASFPSAGVIRVRSNSLFADAESPACRRFIERAFHSKVISSIAIAGGDAPRADLCYCARTLTLTHVLRRLEGTLGRGWAGEDGPAPRDVASSQPVRDGRETVRYYRHDSLVTAWEVKSDLPGRLRLKNPVLFRKSALCHAIERELTGSASSRDLPGSAATGPRSRSRPTGSRRAT